MAEVNQSELSAGTVLSGGKYVIEGKIGAGGFGITYSARHTILDRKCAIKEFFMNGYNVRDNESNHVSLQGLELKDFNRIRQAFINEARTLAYLNNEAIVEVIDIFDENGTSYMVMPFVEGVTLKRMVENDGPMETEKAVEYMVQICRALTYIHSKDVLHRDVTPDNIIVTPEHKIVLIDFGSARKFIDNKTQRQTTIVKPGYAPLEQHSVESRKGAFTDIYSVGAVFYYLLTGKRPMDATQRVMEKMTEPIELNSNIPPHINTVIMKAMEMDGEMRYQSAKELIDDILSDEPANTEKPLDAAARLTKELVEPQKLNPTTPPEDNRTILETMNLKKEDLYQSVRDSADDLKNKTKDVSPQEKDDSHQPDPKKRRVLWLILAVILLSGAVLGIYKFFHRDTHVSEIEDTCVDSLRSTYEQAVDEFDSICGYIIKDSEGSVGVKEHVVDALSALQNIERSERDSLFYRLEYAPVFVEKLQQYRYTLVETKNKILNENRKAFDRGDSDLYTVMMRERLEYVDYILTQTKGYSVLNVQTSMPNEQIIPE